jgi:protein SCO1
MRPFLCRVVALAWVVATVVGCGNQASSLHPAPTGSRAREGGPGRTSERHKLTGLVRKVDPEHRTVTIHHDPIAGFMPAMTMPFTLKDRSAFDDLRVGDEVEATLRVEKEAGEVVDYELLGLVVTRPAPPTGLTLNVGPDGQASLSPTPQRIVPGDLVPDFTMTTQKGTPLRLSELRGQVVVLTFIYTRCPLPDFCPAVDRKFAELASRIAAVEARASRVRLLSVSFDPEHDTPDVLRKHATLRGARPPLWTFAVASHDELAKVAAPLGLTYGPTAGEIIHNLSTAVIGADGRLVRLDAGAAGKAWQPADLLKTIYPRIANSK